VKHEPNSSKALFIVLSVILSWSKSILFLFQDLVGCEARELIYLRTSEQLPVVWWWKNYRLIANNLYSYRRYANHQERLQSPTSILD
jgi:hypothetical protein